MEPTIRYKGIAVFQYLLDQLVEDWFGIWHATLSNVDKVLKVQVRIKSTVRKRLSSLLM
jgi:hypothetical protein